MGGKIITMREIAERLPLNQEFNSRDFTAYTKIAFGGANSKLRYLMELECLKINKSKRTFTYIMTEELRDKLIFIGDNTVPKPIAKRVKKKIAEADSLIAAELILKKAGLM